MSGLGSAVLGCSAVAGRPASCGSNWAYREFWDSRLAGSGEEVPWEKVLRLLVVNRLLDPGSEFGVHRQWYLSTAMDALLGTGFAVAEKDRLYRCLDRVLEHEQELFDGNARSGPTCFKRVAVLEKLAEIQMIDVWIPTVDQRWLILPRHTQPSADTSAHRETETGVAQPAVTAPHWAGRSQRMEVQSVR